MGTSDFSAYLGNQSNIEQNWWANLSSDPKDWVFCRGGEKLNIWVFFFKKNCTYGNFTQDSTMILSQYSDY